MPTYAQLRTESWWGREIVTAEFDWLGDELCRRTNRPRNAFGAKGDNAHLRGAHRSQEWIQKSRYCTSRSYTVQSGLTATQERHVAGIDFTPGSAPEMVAQCKRLYTAVRSGQLEEVREFYGNVDGDRIVDGWNNVRNLDASSDSSHLWHWHLTIDRRRCADRALMERILRIVLGEDDDVITDEDITKLTRAFVNQKLGSSGPTVQVALQTIPALDRRLTALEKLVTTQAEDIAREILAGLPADRDDVTVEELTEAFRRAVAGSPS